MAGVPETCHIEFCLCFTICMNAVDGIVTLAKEADSESVQLRAWRAILADQIAVSKFSDLEYRLAEIEEIWERVP